MESYREIKARHQAEVNAFPMGVAFGRKQFAEMMQKFGLPNDESGIAKITSIGCGCFILRENVPAWNEMVGRHERELKEMCKSPQEFKRALRYEFQNHESQFNRDDEVILGCLGLTVDEVNSDPEMQALYHEAWGEFWEDCKKNDWF